VIKRVPGVEELRSFMGASQSYQRRPQQTGNPPGRAPTYLDTIKLVLLSAGWAIVQWVRHELEQSHIRALEGAPQEERRRVIPFPVTYFGSLEGCQGKVLGADSRHLMARTLQCF
jgi:hypothetical protein